MEQTRLGVTLQQKPHLAETVSATFIQNIQHEIRTPLAVVLGYAELLCAGELGELTPEQRQAINVITARAGRLRGLLEQMNVLLDASLGQCASERLNLSELVDGVVRHWRCFRPGLTLRARLQPGVGIRGDLAQLSQAIDCLLDNAFKFTSHGGQIEVSLAALRGIDVGTCPSTEGQAQGQLWARLMVSDSGIGMSERDVMCLLEGTLFYQADGGLDRCHAGCGLGLTLVKAVVHLHGGWLEIGSQPGQGSCFVLMLPAMASDS